MLKKIEKLLEENFGLISDKSTRDKLLKFIHKRSKNLKISFNDYINLLINDENKVEWNKLVEEITINESYFFRVPQHFELLKKISLEILEKKGKLNILSEACCTGEEPYTIAIVLKENLSPEDFKKVYILGTDVNKKNLEIAKEGIYSKRKVQLCSEIVLKKYFTKHMGNRYKLSEEIKKTCVFKYHNLLDYNYTDFFKRKFDIIFLRNVMIYFKKESNKKILEEIYKLLEDDGFLFTGASESLWGITDKFEVDYFKDTFFYKKSLFKKPRQNTSKIELSEFLKQNSVNIKVKHPPLNESIKYMPEKEKEDIVKILADLLEQQKIKIFYEKFENLKIKGETLNKDLIFLKGIALFKEKKFEEALKEFKKLTFLDIDLITPRLFISICYKNLNKKDEEKKEIENIKQILKENRSKKLNAEKYLSETKDLDIESIKKLMFEKEETKSKYQSPTL